MTQKELTRQELNNIVWSACDTFRGAIDPSEYKNYILTMLFIKYLSDMKKDRVATLKEQYGDEPERLERALARERFIIPDGADFETLFTRRDEDNIGELINEALSDIEDANKMKLDGVFRNIDFNSEAALGQTADRNRRLKQLLEDFADERLDLRPSVIGNRDIIGDVYEHQIALFAADAGKKAGEFYTPAEVSTLLAKLVEAQPGDQICDPACGSGSLLIKVAKEIGGEDFYLAGQESNGSTWALCRMNMFLHNMDSARIEWCDTINNPKLIDEDELTRFDVVVANPPFSLKKWRYSTAKTDKFNRFHRGMPPKSRGDYAFISHMIEIALEGKGKVGVVVPHGVLFRGRAEGTIRRKLIEENLLEAVIGLPEKLFYGTSIPAAIMIFNKGRKPWERADTDRDKHVLFIDASEDYADGTRQNTLREQDIEKILNTYQAFEEVDKYAYPATLEELKENDFNLNIPRYVDTFEEEEDIDITAVQKEIEELEAELAETQAKMRAYLEELGLDGNK